MTAINVIRGVTSLTYILIVSPYLLGGLLCYKKETDQMDSYVLRYVAGFFSQLGIWGFLALPITLFTREWFPFHILCNVFLILTIVLSTVRIAQLVRGKINLKEHIMIFLSRVKSYYSENLLCRIALGFSMFISASQLFRIIYSIRKPYDDNTTYIAGIVETLFHDRIMFTWLRQDKLILAPWHSYLAFLSYFSNVHAIFLCETVLPVVIFVLFFCVIFLMGKYVFRNDKTHVVLFLTLVFLSLGVFDDLLGVYSYAYNPVIWGKAILYTTALPFSILLFFLTIEEKELSISVLLLILSGAGAAWLSMVSVATFILTFIVLGLYFGIIKRNPYLIGHAVCFIIPTVFQSVAFFLWYLERNR